MLLLLLIVASVLMAFVDAQPQVASEASSTLLSLALASPKLVKEHDKVEWLNMFDQKDGFIEDPVSAPRHRDLSQFYETFIAPNLVTFHAHKNFVDRVNRVVMRDVDLEIKFPNGATMLQPVIIKYTFSDHDKLLSLQAYWSIIYGKPEINSLGDGWRYLTGSTMQFWTIIQNHGLMWTLRYLAGFARGFMSGGPTLVKKFAKTIATDPLAHFHDQATITFGTSHNITVSEFLKTVPMLSLDVEKVYDCGSYTAAILIGRVGNDPNTCQELVFPGIFEIQAGKIQSAFFVLEDVINKQ